MAGDVEERPRHCAVNACRRHAAGMASWPDQWTRVALCHRHATILRAPVEPPNERREAFLRGPILTSAEPPVADLRASRLYCFVHGQEAADHSCEWNQAIPPITPEDEAAMRAWIDWQFASHAADDPGPPHPTHIRASAGLYASLLAEIDRLRAALRDPAPLASSPEPLRKIDVYALERAYVKVIDRTPWAEVVFSAQGGVEVQRRMLLERIAAEYGSALKAETPDPAPPATPSSLDAAPEWTNDPHLFSASDTSDECAVCHLDIRDAIHVRWSVPGRESQHGG